MTSAAPAAEFEGRGRLSRVREAANGLPLRTRLVALFVVLAGLGLFISATVATTSLSRYLLSRIDNQLTNVGSGGPGDGSLLHGDRFTTVYVGVLTPNGLQPLRVPPGVSGPQPPNKVNTLETVSSVRSSEAAWRVVAYRDGQGNTYVFGIHLDEYHHTISRLVALEVLVGGLVLFTLAGTGYLLVRYSLKPLIGIERAAEAIAAGDLTRRVPIFGGQRSEVGSLAQSFNAMLGRIEASFAEQHRSEVAAVSAAATMRQFVADASHELRTPLTSIRGFAELHRQGAMPDESAITHAMGRIEAQAVRMGTLVDELLLLARLDQRRPLDDEKVDLRVLAAEAVLETQPADPSREVLFEATPNGPCFVRGDSLRLRQVVGNLVTNALTHTPPGTEIAVLLVADRERATLRVRDRGAGVPADLRDKIFDRFVRGDSSRTRASGGSGLGLAIVASIVEAHHGEVWLEDTPGGGATFSVALPIEKVTSAIESGISSKSAQVTQ